MWANVYAGVRIALFAVHFCGAFCGAFCCAFAVSFCGAFCDVFYGGLLRVPFALACRACLCGVPGGLRAVQADADAGEHMPAYTKQIQPPIPLIDLGTLPLN